MFVGCVFACIGRALEWHSRGHGFDPHRLHQKKPSLLLCVAEDSLGEIYGVVSYGYTVFSFL